jgi:hypothetical protein
MFLLLLLVLQPSLPLYRNQPPPLQPFSISLIPSFLSSDPNSSLLHQLPHFPPFPPDLLQSSIPLVLHGIHDPLRAFQLILCILVGRFV